MSRHLPWFQRGVFWCLSRFSVPHESCQTSIHLIHSLSIHRELFLNILNILNQILWKFQHWRLPSLLELSFYSNCLISLQIWKMMNCMLFTPEIVESHRCCACAEGASYLTRSWILTLLGLGCYPPINQQSDVALPTICR